MDEKTELIPDIAKLREALAYAEKYPDQHDQEHWTVTDGNFDVRAGNGDRPPCGTSLCFGGWLAFLNAPSGTQIMDHGYVRLPDGEHELIGTYAARNAGLNMAQGCALFFASTSIADLRSVVDFIADHPDALYREIEEGAAVHGYIAGQYLEDELGPFRMI